tara:strand:- start:3517 stop:4293 length:777 start_codon:yes stop_codon:yes gene_type:complete
MDYILSEKNKGFLWNILYEKNIFNGIPNDNLDKVKNLFESTIVNVSQNTKNKEIIEINKEILSTLNREIQSLKRNLLESKNTKDEFKDEKIVVFDKNLENHKSSLNKLINPDKPKEIDFADETDKPIDNNEMNRILEQMQKDRNIETNNIEIKISDEKIIEPDNIMSESKNDEVPKIKIESIEELLETEVVNLNEPVHKKVDELKTEGEKLKSISKLLESEYKEESKLNSNIKLDSINKLLNKLLINQEKIMSKLDLV